MAKLYFKYGPMKSGKTTDLIKTYYNYQEKGFSVIILKPGDDKKAGENILSRSGAMLKCNYVIKKDVNIYNLINHCIIDDNNNIDCILVDEAQFLTPEQVDNLGDVVDFLDIPVICYGLRADAFTNLFPGSKRLFEVSDVIEELKAICKCGERATVNIRYNKIMEEYIPVFTGEQISIDGIDSYYDSVCRKCYKTLKRKYYNYTKK